MDDDAGTIAAPSLPAPEVINNKDGTKTVISFRINDEGKKAKVTRRIRTTVMREQVNPRVAERRTWKKYGLEEGRAAGPALETTSLAENIVFRPNVRWKEIAEKEAEESANAGGATEEKKEKVFRCRICTGEHFTARCPLKGSMAPIEDVASPAHPPPEVQPPSGLGGRSGYVPPHLRNRPAGAGPPERPGRHDRDDLATLRVTNVSFHNSSNSFAFSFASEGRGLTTSIAERIRRRRRTSRNVLEVWQSH